MRQPPWSVCCTSLLVVALCVAATAAQECHTKANVEYDGQVALWGSNNIQPDAAACCESCRVHRAESEANGKPPCMFWVFCGDEAGCDSQKFGECWGKRSANAGTPPLVRNSGEHCKWTSGAVYTEAEAAAIVQAEQAVLQAALDRRDRAGNPRVFFDVEINGETTGRIEFVLYAHESPRAAENFRAMCTGEKGGKLTYTGMKFYRIIDRFIDQAGVHGTASTWGGSFDDDPGGLRLHHDKPGLLSAANSGPDSNSGHFSIVVAPASHLDGGYTVFGEVVEGMSTVLAVNKLTNKGTDRVTGNAIVRQAGCLLNCEPRPEVGPKCQERELTPTPVQGRPIRKCID